MPQIKCGGSFKTFTAILSNSEDVSAENIFQWDIEYPEGAEDNFETVKDNNILKIKCKAVYDMIGEILTIKVTSGTITASIEVEVIGL